MKKAQFEHMGGLGNTIYVRVHMWNRLVGADKIFDQEFAFKVDDEAKNIFALEPIPAVPEGKRTWFVEPIESSFPENAAALEWQTHIGGIWVRGSLAHLVSGVWEFTPAEATLFGDLEVEGSQWFR